MNYKRQTLAMIRERAQTAIDFNAMTGDTVTVLKLGDSHSDEDLRSLASQLQHNNLDHEIKYFPVSRAFVIVAVEKVANLPVASLAAARVALGR